MTRQGVYFRPEDCAGFWRRLLVDAIDLVLALVLFALFALPAVVVAPDDYSLQNRVAFAVLVAIWLLYFVILKWSRFRTLGYRCGRVRLVDLQGEPASLFAVAFRAAFMIFGPLNYIFDLMWLSGDSQRQALRDKIAHTYVVKSGATPAGVGPLVHTTYNLGGMTLHFPEVRMPPANPCMQPPGSARG